MLRRWIAACAAVVIIALGLTTIISLASSHTPTARVEQSKRLVFIEVPELTWNASTRTEYPELASLADSGAVGDLLVRNISAHSCRRDSWLTISAIQQTGWEPRLKETKPGEPPPECYPIPEVAVHGDSASFSKWPLWRGFSTDRNSSVRIGRLGSAFEESGRCLVAAGPGAAVGAADRDGVVHHYVAQPDKVDFRSCPVTLVSLPPKDRASNLSAMLKRIPPGTTVVVAGLSDDTTREHVRAVVVSGPDVQHGRLTSLNTRQPSVVTTTDVARLIASRSGVTLPTSLSARDPLILPDSDRAAPLDSAIGLGRELAVEHSVTQSFFFRALGLAVLVLLLGTPVALYYRRRARAAGKVHWSTPPLRAAGMWVAGAMASLPVSTFLVGLTGWWRAPHPGITLTFGVIAIAAALSAIAFFGPWRRWRTGPMSVILLVTAGTVALDVVHGSRLQFTAMMGLQPVYGGRYYGMGNVGYAMMATSALVLAAICAGHLISKGHRRLAAVTVVLIGIPTVIIDGYPEWGADAGGPAAFVPALAYLALNAAGLKVTWQRVAVIGGSTAAFITLLGFADFLRPPKYRTHLGDFVADVVQRGEWGGVGDILHGNWVMLTSAWYMMITPLLLIGAIALLVAPDRPWLRPVKRLWTPVPFLGHGLVAAVICWTLGFFANDSGAGIPPNGLFVLAPLIFALGIRKRDTPSGRTQTAEPAHAD